MPISTNIQEVADRISAEITQSGNGTSQTAADLHVKAVAAILSGNKDAEGQVRPAWKAYMSTFAKDAQELARLIPTDGTDDDPVMRDARAYLVANGTCGTGTTMTIQDNVTNRLDIT